MARYQIQAKANNDIDEIYADGIETWGLAQARRYLLGLHERFEFLADNPNIGIKLGGTHRVGRTTLQAHHLIEKRLTKQFGIPDRDGIAVALDADDHGIFTREIPEALSRIESPFYDIDEIYDAHRRVYLANNHPEWIPHIRNFLRRYRDQIRSRYESGNVPGADLPDFSSRRERALQFLDDL